MGPGFLLPAILIEIGRMYRLFAALPVDPDIAPGLKALQTGLSGASWRPERNFHITLRFFGDLNHVQARDLDDLLGDIRAPALEIRLEGIGWFGRREPSAVWARVRETDEHWPASANVPPAASACRPTGAISHRTSPSPTCMAPRCQR